MSDVALFDQGGQVPAHIRAMFGTPDNNDLSAGVSGGFPVLSIKGKVWHLVQGGVRTLLTTDGTPNGDPRSSIEVVVVKANPHVSKIYYADGYTEGSDERPTCSSSDGIAPAEDSTEKQALKCAVCPRNVWGSRVTENGAKGKECSDARRLAVAPGGDLSNPMLLRVPAASLKELQIYGDMLSKRGTPYQALVTKIGFDHTVAHQKLTFKPVRWLSAEEVTQVAETMKGSVVSQIIGDNPAPSQEVDTSELDALPGAPAANAQAVAPAPAATAPKPRGRPPKAPVTTDDVAAALKPAPSTGGFGAPEKPAAVAPVVQATPVAPKRDHSALLAEADASLDDILATMDD